MISVVNNYISLSAIRYGVSFALKRGLKVFKANMIVILCFWTVLSLIQIWQEGNNPVIRSTSIEPYKVEGNSGIVNYCFRWSFDIKRPSELTTFLWVLKTPENSYFVTPWIKEQGFAGSVSPDIIKQGNNVYNLCVSSFPKENIELLGTTVFKVWIFGIPWSNSYDHVIKF